MDDTVFLIVCNPKDVEAFAQVEAPQESLVVTPLVQENHAALIKKEAFEELLKDADWWVR